MLLKLSCIHVGILFSFLGKENVIKMFHFILQENCPNLIDLDVSGTNIRKIHIEKLQVRFCLLSSIETVTLFSHVLSGRMGTGDRFMEIHGSGKLLLFTFKIEVSVIFAYNMMIKLSVKWTGLLAWRNALVLKILIWIFDFWSQKVGPRNRTQGR